MISIFKATVPNSVFSSDEPPTTQEAPQEESWLNRLDRGYRLKNGILGWQHFFSCPALYHSLFGEVTKATARGATAASLGRAAVASYLGASFLLGVGLGIGINYLPYIIGDEKTVGDRLGDAATDYFGPCDLDGTFFKVGRFLGLA